MSDDKTESPTQFRLREQRKKGNIPQRKNATEAICLLSSVAILAALAPHYSAATFVLFDIAMTSPTQSFTQGIIQSCRYVYPLAYFTLAFSVGSAGVTLLSTLLFNKFNVAPSALSPKFDKLNPVNGLKRIISKATLYNALRLTIYFGAIACLLYLFVVSNIHNAHYAMLYDVDAIFLYFLRLFRHIVIGILSILCTLAVLDWWIQSRLFLSQSKMSKDEVRREYKSQEGDPQIKSARKAIAQQDSHIPLAKEATHVIYSNELLVAIIFNETSGMPPFMVARVKGSAVGAVKHLYRNLRIPTLYMPRVANDFFNMAQPGKFLLARSAEGMSEILNSLERKVQNETY
ncbi:EscU/YscU/HrcU family type III secretion system export apparatus switch protein [Ochrobactrum sp. Marseille-Q0166]|uniref:EscU/YscU/HrcU family type III secretion system export apparatus switch protein n=1 Tax=Ochrobactrum sp. Marseille-Q0166 TaxID=2761105 RepID=UPI001655A8F6|nr:EscU/YscU/HrcU family type III secretion system export apparatus switch protein [Ochrobactrum sp. Marseille-Q0166]MBC8719600.1 EscU/YscU/HrcU family type III secretion system export apparatus switch protein [Ochrobactrum sp. Marseille-Q0166]